MYAILGVSPEPPAPLRKVPVLTLKPRQVVGLPERLRAFWNRFAPLFQRREQREWGLSNYLRPCDE